MLGTQDSNDEWTMKETKANSSLDVSDKYILVEVREYKGASKGGVAALYDDLDVPLIADNDEGHGDDINKMKIMSRRTKTILRLI